MDFRASRNPWRRSNPPAFSAMAASEDRSWRVSPWPFEGADARGDVGAACLACLACLGFRPGFRFTLGIPCSLLILPLMTLMWDGDTVIPYVARTWATILEGEVMPSSRANLTAS